MRTRLLALAAGALVAAGAGVLVPSAAQAAPAAPTLFGIPAITIASVTMSHPLYTIGDPVVAHVDIQAPGAVLNGTWTLKFVAPGPSTGIVELNKPVNTSHLVVDEPIAAVPAGEYTVTVSYAPNDSSTTPAIMTTGFSARLGGVSLSESHDPLVAGKGGSMVATVKLPSGSQTVGGTIHLEVDAAADVATCAPARTSPTTAQCTLGLPASLAAGSHPANLNWEGSPTFIQANATETLTVSAPKSSSGSGSGSSGSKGATGSGGSGAAAVAGGATVPSASATPSPAVPATATPVAAAGDQPGVDPTATSASSPIPLLPILIAVIALLLVAAIIVTVVLVVRSRKPAGPTA